MECDKNKWNPSSKFRLDEIQVCKLETWMDDVIRKGVQKQQAVIDDPGIEYTSSWDCGYPYAGAIGGQFTYRFTPNALGIAVRVRDAITGLEIDLTDYGSW